MHCHFSVFLLSKSFRFHFSSLQSKEAKVEPISTPPTLSPPSEDAELSGEPVPEGTLETTKLSEPVPEGTPETTNLSVILHSSPEQGKSRRTFVRSVLSDNCMPSPSDGWNIEHLIQPLAWAFARAPLHG